MLTLTNEDNMVMMARYPDKYFDLAIVDPPYGGGANAGSGGHFDRYLVKEEAKPFRRSL